MVSPALFQGHTLHHHIARATLIRVTAFKTLDEGFVKGGACPKYTVLVA